MMEALEYWNIFEQTGDIRDYLNYTACTSEGEHVLEQTKSQCAVTRECERESEHDKFY